MQGAFLHQISPFLVFGLVIKLFCGSFKDFGEIPFLGPKTAQCIPKICHFLNFTFLPLQVVFLHQISPFLVFRLVIKLFCGSFIDFGKIPFLGPKTAQYVPKICHFFEISHFDHCRVCFFMNYCQFWLQPCYNDAFWKFYKNSKESLGGGG